MDRLASSRPGGGLSFRLLLLAMAAVVAMLVFLFNTDSPSPIELLLIQGFAVVFMGWPGIIGSFVLSLAGIATRRPMLVLWGAVLAISPSTYLSMTPAYRWWGLALPLPIAVAAWALRTKARWPAWVLALFPYALVAVRVVWALANRP